MKEKLIDKLFSHNFTLEFKYEVIRTAENKSL